MTVSAYILIQTDLGKTSAVADEVREIDGVSFAPWCHRPYDIIARAEADRVDELGHLVVSKVQSVDAVTRTLTCPVVIL
jgi:DNA-binding Lrp family transcriptional regulator